MTEVLRRKRCCNDLDCGVSTGICGSLTFGKGELDDYGYWQHPCGLCARDYEKRHPEEPVCWPFELRFQFKIEKQDEGTFNARLGRFLQQEGPQSLTAQSAEKLASSVLAWLAKHGGRA